MIYPFLLCAFASFATGAGGVLVVMFRNMTEKTISVFQGFAAGVMVTISFTEMLPNCFDTLMVKMGTAKAAFATGTVFFIGWLMAIIIGIIVDFACGSNTNRSSLEKVSLITTAVMILHNLPEGMLTIFSGFGDKQFAAEMALAVALHNIPEGVVVASGVLCITASKKKAVYQSFFAGLCEFIGGVAAVVIFGDFVSESFISAVLAAVSGIMVQTSLCQLVPDSIKISSPRYTFYGVTLGIAVIYLGIFTI